FIGHAPKRPDFPARHGAAPDQSSRLMNALRFPKGLYGITPEWDDTDRLLQAIEAAARGGMTALQWRRKTIAPHARLPQARQVADLCRAHHIVCIINDDWRLAAAIDADGVHLGRDDGSLADARVALGTE